MRIFGCNHGERRIHFKCHCNKGTSETCATRAASAPAFPAQKSAKRRSRAFAQILGKLYFFKSGENLRRILFDYGQKRPGAANAAFNPAC
jgi:hypothetical protein